MRTILDDRGADISPCGKYRYSLWRDWDWQGFANRVMFVGLNPSTADATNDDPTIRRCVRFATDWGFGGLVMVNLFAYRATDPDTALPKAAADGVKGAIGLAVITLGYKYFIH